MTQSNSHVMKIIKTKQEPAKPKREKKNWTRTDKRAQEKERG